MYLTRNQASRLRDRGFESHPFRHRINDLPNILSFRNRAFNSVDGSEILPSQRRNPLPVGAQHFSPPVPGDADYVLGWLQVRSVSVSCLFGF